MTEENVILLKNSETSERKNSKNGGSFLNVFRIVACCFLVVIIFITLCKDYIILETNDDEGNEQNIYQSPVEYKRYDLEHVDGHGADFRISYGDNSSHFYLHSSVISTTLLCSNAIKYKDKYEIFSNGGFKGLANYRIVYWIESEKKYLIKPDYHGCFTYPKGKSHFFFTSNLVVDSSAEFDVEIFYISGMLLEKSLPVRRIPRTRSFIIPASRKSSMLILADSGPNGAKSVMGSIFNRTKNMAGIIHIGDLSYASNSGDCYAARKGKASEEMNRICAWDCPVTDESCRGRGRNNEKCDAKWRSFMNFLNPVQEKLPFMTTTGNHDNDLYWFYKYRPPHASSHIGVSIQSDLSQQLKKSFEQLQRRDKLSIGNHQALVSDILREPYFYKFSQGNTLFISLCTEDNPINAYEINRVNNGSLPVEFRTRFEQHFGKLSKQYQWLKKTLKNVNRTVYPWVIVFAHRPMFHTNMHHSLCSGSGDWYGCHFRNLYSEIFERYGVNLVLSGHSHHYSRTLPIRNSFNYSLNDHYLTNMPVNTDEHQELKGRLLGPRNAELKKDPVIDRAKGVVYIVLGTAGYKLDNSFDPGTENTEWVAFKQGKVFGYATVETFDAHSLKWQYIGIKQGKDVVLDVITINNIYNHDK